MYAVGYKESRVKLHVNDGRLFLRSVPRGTYDAIIVDAFEPMRPDHEPFKSQSFENDAKALRPGGVLCLSAESLWLQYLDIEQRVNKCRQIFKGSTDYACTSVTAYPSGISSLLLCSTVGPHVDFRNPINAIDPENYGISKQPLKFYNSEVHSAAFCLPSFAERFTKTKLRPKEQYEVPKGSDVFSTET